MFSRLNVLVVIGGFAGLVGLSACARTEPARKPDGTAADGKVPTGCRASQAGDYRHADDPTFRYRASDDGQQLLLTLLRPQTPIPGTTNTAAPRIELRRTSEGFVGQTIAVGLTGAGKPCPVRYSTEVLACDPQGLVLRSVASATIDERCQAAAEVLPRWVEQRLLRVP